MTNASCTTCDDVGLPALPTAAATSEASSRSAWLAVGSLSVGSFAMVTTEFLPIGLLTDIAGTLGVSTGTAGLMVTTPGLLATFAGPALIVASGRLDRRTVMLALSALLVASNLLAALAPNFATMLLARVFLGLAVGGFWTFAPSAATQLVPAASQARAMSIVLAGISAATVLGVPAGAFLGTLAGWRAAFAVTGVLAALVLAAQLWLLPALPPARAIRPRDLLTPFGQRMARVGLVIMLFMVAGHFAAYTYLKPLLQQVFGLSPNAVTALLLVYGATGFIGTFVGGSIAARTVRGTMLLATLMLTVALLLAATLGTGMVAATLVVVIWGLGFGLVPVAATSWMLAAVPETPEAGQALLVSAFQIAIASGAVLGGMVVNGWGVSSAMLFGGTLMVVATVIVLSGLVLGRIGRPIVAA